VRLISARDPGSKVKISVLRDGKEVNLSANLGDRPSGSGGERSDQGEGGQGPGVEENETKLGITVEELTPSILQEIGLPRDTKGVVITHVSRVSEAWEKQLNNGDVVVEVNRVPVSSLSEYRKEIRKAKPNSLLVLYDDAQSIYERARNKQFSFKSVGIQAQGRTTILVAHRRSTLDLADRATRASPAPEGGCEREHDHSRL